MITQEQANELERLHQMACQARVGAALLFYNGVDDDGTGFWNGPRAAEIAFKNYLTSLIQQPASPGGRDDR